MPHELILGGQRSGKSRCAESRAADWLEQPGRSAVLLATALAGDDEMRARITRHQADRARRVPALMTVEEPRDLARAVRQHSAPSRLVVIDCLTLWLTNLLMPMQGDALDDVALEAATAALCESLRRAPGPVLLVSNEIGLGLSSMSPSARRFVDELGRLHQLVAQECERVSLMVAGIELPVKRPTP
jgi:adenosylcobinamide kinase / adenosylcobinamide-phosphate guanylyltransferase